MGVRVKVGLKGEIRGGCGTETGVGLEGAIRGGSKGGLGGGGGHNWFTSCLVGFHSSTRSTHVTTCVLESRVLSDWTFQTFRRLTVLPVVLHFVPLPIERWFAVLTLRSVAIDNHRFRITIEAFSRLHRIVGIHQTTPAWMHIEWTRAWGANDFGAFSGCAIDFCAYYTFAFADIIIISIITIIDLYGSGGGGGSDGGIRGGSKGGLGGGRGFGLGSWGGHNWFTSYLAGIHFRSQWTLQTGSCRQARIFS